MTRRTVTILLCALDAVIAVAIIAGVVFEAPDPQLYALDQAMAALVGVLLLVTAVPAAVLLWRGGSPRWALGLALAFPAILVTLLAATAIFMFTLS